MVVDKDYIVQISRKAVSKRLEVTKKQIVQAQQSVLALVFPKNWKVINIVLKFARNVRSSR